MTGGNGAAIRQSHARVCGNEGGNHAATATAEDCREPDTLYRCQAAIREPDELFAQVVDGYLDGLQRAVVADRFVAWARAEGLALTRHDGFILARRGQRVVGICVTFAYRSSRRHRLPTTPCASCGARPVGTFDDGSPRYDCHRGDPERHVPLWPEAPA